jgi:hypothetical protein
MGGCGGVVQPPRPRLDLLWELGMRLLQRVPLGVEQQHMDLDRPRGLVPFRLRTRAAQGLGVLCVGRAHYGNHSRAFWVRRQTNV